MFGEDKLDEDTVLYYAQRELHLPSTYEQVLVQLGTTLQLLKLFTRERGIASEYHREGFHLWESNPHLFQGAMEQRPTYGVEFLFY